MFLKKKAICRHYLGLWESLNLKIIDKLIDNELSLVAALLNEKRLVPTKMPVAWFRLR